VWITAALTLSRPIQPKPETPDQHAEKTPQSKRGDEEYWETLWQRTVNEPIALYTAALTVFTALLAGVSTIQFRYVIRADRTAAIAANAALATAQAIGTQNTHIQQSIAEAKRAADAMGDVANAMGINAQAAQDSVKAVTNANQAAIDSAITLNRAYIYFHLISDTCDEFFLVVTNSIEFTWDVINFGKTPGRTTAIAGGVILSAEAPLVVPPSPTRRFGKIILAERESSDQYTSSVKGLTAEHRHALMTRQTAIWFAGAVRYNDIFGKSRQTGWGFMYDIEQRELSTDGVPPAYNYQT
jgi:hypothetical protein